MTLSPLPADGSGASGRREPPRIVEIGGEGKPTREDFARQVRDALAHLDDPAYLQAHSLTRFVYSDRNARQASLGRALRQALLDAVESLRPGPESPPASHSFRRYQIAKLRFVDGLDIPSILDKLSVSRSVYFVDQQRAVEAITSLLSETWGQNKPTFSSAPKPSRIAPDEGDHAPAPEPSQARLHNLPTQLTNFVGRGREIAEVKRLLGTTRLLTLTGTGGSGKTRLAYQVAADLLAENPDEYPDGIWIAELAALSDPALVPNTVASALEVPERPDQPILTVLTDHLKATRHLLVLDNCEHLLDACASLADSLLRPCPRLQLLTTSREALGISGETSYRVPSLALPDIHNLPPLTSLTECESVRLFVERAKAVQPSFQVTAGNALAVAQICCRLDGMPLALELAAARVRGLTVEQIASRLDDRFRLLTGGSRVALRRQQTLRAAIDWSYDLLAEPERVLFRRLAVFAGGWTLEAAEKACSGEEGDEATIGQVGVLDLLLRLVDCSLVVAEEVAGAERYRLLETIREYAQDKLLESGEVFAVRDRHFAWYLALAVKGASELFGPEQRKWLEGLELEHDNLRAALDWSLTKEESDTSLGLAAALGEFWSRGWWHLAEGQQRMRAVLARPGGAPNVRAKMLWRAGELESAGGNWLKARELYEEGLRLARETGDSWLISGSLLHVSFVAYDLGEMAKAYALRLEALNLARDSGILGGIAQTAWDVGAVLFQLGRLGESRAVTEESLTNYTAVGNVEGIALCLFRLGYIALWEGDLERGRVLTEDGLAKAREAHTPRVVVHLLGLRGDIARAEGDHPAARRRYQDALELTKRQPGDRQLAVSTLIRIAGLAAAQGAAERAARLFGVVHGWHEAMGLPVLHEPHRDYERDEEAARQALGEAAFSRAWAEGQAMTLEHAVEYALRDEE